MPSDFDNEAIRSTVLRVLLRMLNASGRGKTDIDDQSKLLELGLIDSEDLIEIILQVEQQCSCEFDPEEMDLEAGLTLSGLIGAFVPRGGDASEAAP